MIKTTQLVSEELTQGTSYRDKEIKSMKEQLRDIEDRLTVIMGMIPSNFQIMVNSKKQGIVIKNCV